MKNIKIFAIGVIGAALFLTSCHKEKECECLSETTYTGTYEDWSTGDVNDTTWTSKDTNITFTEQKCWELETGYSNRSYDWGSSKGVRSRTVECDKK